MQKRKTVCALLLTLLLLLATATPAFAAKPGIGEYAEFVAPPEPDAAVEMPEHATQDVDWEAVMDDIWNLLFVGETDSVSLLDYHIPKTEDNKEFIYNSCYYSPRFLRLAPILYNNGTYYTSAKNVNYGDHQASDPVENRAKYDACVDTMTQLMYGVKGNDSLSDVDKCLLLHDRLAAWVAYDYAKYNAGTLEDDDYSAYGPLALHCGVCNGYALAYNWMLDELGFTTYYTRVSTENLNHGWSKVVLDSEPYYVDVTWDDPVWDIPGRVTHEHFMQSFSMFSAGHYGASDFDQTPDSTIYESYIDDNFGEDIQSEIVLVGNKYYFFDNKDNRGWLCSCNVGDSASNVQQLVKSDIMYQVNGSIEGWPNPKLVAIGDTILYTTSRTVRAYNTTTGVDSLAYTPDAAIFPDSSYFLNGLRQVDGVVYVTSVNNMDGLFDETTVADNTDSFIYCNHPTTVTLSQTTGPDCQTPGDKELICPACRALLDGTGQGPVGSHSYTAQTVKDAALKAAATCTTKAVYYYSCAACGAVEGNDSHTFLSGSTAPHSWIWVTDTEATCGAAGTKHEECSVCHTTRNQNTAIPATGNHTFVWVTDTEATCGAAGTKHEECTACHTTHSENTAIPATGNHTFAWVTDTAATCGAAGTKHEECTACHTTRNENTAIPATGNHTFAWVTDTAATCGAAGTKHEECSVCHMTRSENTTIPATGNHSYTAQDVKPAALKTAATCTAKAVYYYSCAACGAVEGSDSHTFQSGSTAPHTYTAQTVKADALKTAATCMAAAVYYYSCAGCGAVEGNDSHTFTNGTTIAHNWQWITDTAATCGAAGTKHEECSVCHATRNENTTIPATGNHTFAWVIDTEATCSTAGVKHEECTACHTIRNENSPISATGNHSYTAQTVKADALKAEATCTAKAVYYYSCAVCGAVEGSDSHTFTSGTTAPHTYTAQTVKADALKAAATCTAKAVYYYSCAACGAVEGSDSHTFTSGSTAPHTYTAQTVKADALKAAATCTAKAVYYYSCAACGAVEGSDSHTFTSGSTAPHTYTAQTVKAEALQTAATCTAAAVYYYSCVNCGAVEGDDSHTFQSGATATHNWQWVEDVAATCERAGVKHEECSVCHDKRSENTPIPASGNHTYTAQTVKAEALQAAATCEAAAVYYYSCATCGAVEGNDSHTFQSGLALGHDWREASRQDATCDKPGKVTYVCTHDETHVRSESIPAKSHTDANGDGYCDNCGKDLLPNRCAYCGKVHSGAFGWLIRFFHRILAIFKR